MKHFNPYQFIANKTISNAINDIFNRPAISLDNLKVSDLSIGGNYHQQPVFRLDKTQIFGRGIYIVTFKNKNWCYVGQTNKNFFDRLMAQTYSRYREHRGWNALLLFIADKLNYDKRFDLEKAKKYLITHGEIRFIYVDLSFNKFIKLENLIMYGIIANGGKQLLNSKQFKPKNNALTVSQHII